MLNCVTLLKNGLPSCNKTGNLYRHRPLGKTWQKNSWKWPRKVLEGVSIIALFSPGELLQQSFSLLQVGGVKALREPAIDWGQQLAGLAPLTLTFPQAAQAQRRAQFQGLRLLVAGDIEGMVHMVFGFRLGRGLGPVVTRQ